MTPDTLAAEVEARRPESLATASRLGPSARPTLVRLSRHADPEVRAQALHCLKAVGGEEATQCALVAINDEDATVVAFAIQVLHAHPPAGDEQLLRAYDVQDETRDQLALIAGRVGPEASIAAWKMRRRAAPSGTTLNDSILTALARMGDTEARREFGERLVGARGPDAPAWIERAVYQAHRWVLPPLSVLLDRTERAIELTPDDPSDLRPLRTCDLAANAIRSITGASVNFPAPRATPYSDAEIDAFRKLAGERNAP